MKSVRLVQIFCPVKETNRTHSKAMWRIEGTVRAKKMRQDGSAEFISASYYNRFIDEGRGTRPPLVYLIT